MHTGAGVAKTSVRGRILRNAVVKETMVPKETLLSEEIAIFPKFAVTSRHVYYSWKGPCSFKVQ